MSIRGYFLGCPIWNRKDWIGELFPVGARVSELLGRYARIFNAVEGNTTFYGVPSEKTVARWCAETPEDFVFSCKFPRAISHELRLRDAGAPAHGFLARLAPLGPRLGPTFLQLPPNFGPSEVDVLLGFLDGLPPGRYAVEVRHSAFFKDTAARAGLDEALRARAVDRVLIDTRALFAAPDDDADTRATQQQKPRVPLHCVTTGERPLLRYVGHPDVAANDALLATWAELVAGWILAGKTPHVFLHMPNDFFSPRLARRFHELLSRHVDAGELPDWPGPPVATPAPRGPRQLDLF